MKPLTDKQQRFVEEYLVDSNATQAAIRAGYSKKTANEQGTQNLAKLSIKAAIEEAQKEVSDKLGITQERVAKEYAKLGFANMRDYAKWHDDKVDLTHSDDLTEDQTAAVAEVSQTIGATAGSGSIKFKLHDKKAALDSLSKMFGFFNKDKSDDSGMTYIEYLSVVVQRDKANDFSG